MNDSVGLTCTPSEGRTAGKDDFAQYGLFHHFTCNFSVDENGFNHVDALEGQLAFKKKGKVQELSQNVVRKITMLCGNSFVLGLDKTNAKDRRKTV